LSYYRLQQQVTVPAFSLGFAANADGSRLYASFAAGNGISHIAAVTYLADRWSRLAPRVKASLGKAAAYQVAIWHLSAALPITKRTVHARVIRRAALRLVAYASARDQEQVVACKNANCGEDAPSPQLATTSGDSTVSDQIINIALFIGNLEQSFDDYQALDLRLGGIYATVCTGQDTAINTSKISDMPPRPCAPGFGRHPTQHYDVQVRRDYQKKNGKVNKVYTGTANVYVPRQDHIQYLQVAWNITLKHGDVGGFNRSSQRSMKRGDDGREEEGGGSGGAAGDAFAGASAGGAVGASSAVLGGDRSRGLERGGRGSGGRVGRSRRPVVSGRWRDADGHAGRAVGAVPVVYGA
jgi:hypothetical protein